FGDICQNYGSESNSIYTYNLIGDPDNIGNQTLEVTMKPSGEKCEEKVFGHKDEKKIDCSSKSTDEITIRVKNITSSSAVLSICDIEVYECTDGHYGASCIECTRKCKAGDTCVKSDGWC
ncbi:unnamed protein product, partial [Owenia fusiformis]